MVTESMCELTQLRYSSTALEMAIRSAQYNIKKLAKECINISEELLEKCDSKYLGNKP
jgi:hypothetical protein